MGNEPINIPWRLPTRSMECGPLEEQVSMPSLHMIGGHQELQELHDYSFNLEPSTLTLFTPALNEHIEEENPTPQQCHPPPPSTSSPPDMAYERADPTPFVPPDMPWHSSGEHCANGACSGK